MDPCPLLYQLADTLSSSRLSLFHWTFLGLSEDFWGLSHTFFKRIFSGPFKVFQELSEDFLRTFSGLSQDFLRVYSGLFQGFLRTFSGHSEFGTDCLGLVCFTEGYLMWEFMWQQHVTKYPWYINFLNLFYHWVQDDLIILSRCQKCSIRQPPSQKEACSAGTAGESTYGDNKKNLVYFEEEKINTRDHCTPLNLL